ncbi:IMP 5'-nucleotidase [Boothiomyces sp. JEL0838]|nr:IMP 5'-nucleotidase [Boothiomyces sp. JEL0838]
MSSRTSLYDVTYQLRAHKRDRFIEFIKSLLLTPFILSTKPKEQQDRNTPRYLEILGCIEELVEDHINCIQMGKPDSARLNRLVPSLGRFFTKLPLQQAYEYINENRSISTRRFVPPSFNDIRHLLNHAQILEIAKQLKLITFDGDYTLYADGQDFAKDSALVGLIISLLEHGIKVAIVTAAGYPGDAVRYEQRLSGLLDGFRNFKKNKDIFSNFYVLGGECNYLFQYSPEDGHLHYIPEEEYQPEFLKEWSTDEDRIQEILNVAENHLKKRLKEMGYEQKVSIIRKMRAVGVSPKPGFKLSREQLDELSLAVQAVLDQHNFNKIPGSPTTKRRRIGKSISIPFSNTIPYCAFNGGSDVWVDIGNKLIGVKVLQELLKTEGHETLHVGDQFLSTGNDIATRNCCCTIWITNPEETQDVLIQLTNMLAEI